MHKIRLQHPITYANSCPQQPVMKVLSRGGAGGGSRLAEAEATPKLALATIQQLPLSSSPALQAEQTLLACGGRGGPEQPPLTLGKENSINLSALSKHSLLLFQLISARSPSLFHVSKHHQEDKTKKPPCSPPLQPYFSIFFPWDYFNGILHCYSTLKWLRLCASRGDLH